MGGRVSRASREDSKMGDARSRADIYRDGALIFAIGAARRRRRRAPPAVASGADFP